MGGTPQPVAFSGPRAGLELRDAQQTGLHDQLAVNVDYATGWMRARPAFKVIAAGGGYIGGVLHYCDVIPSNPLLVWAAHTSASVIKASAFTLDGGQVSGSETNLTALGEPDDVTFTASMVTTSLPTSGDPAFGVLLTTKTNAYFLNARNPGAGWRKVSTALVSAGGDTRQFNVANLAYWTTRPHGPIAVEHLDKVWYAGFQDGDEAWLGGIIAASNTVKPGVPEPLVTATRRSFVLTPSVVIYSDEYLPVDVQESHVFMLDGREPVTGLASFRENLIIFGDRSLFVLTGGTDSTFSLVKDPGGVGCVAHRSIVEAEGVLYFMGRDGIYAYGGLGSGVQKVSGPLDPMFQGTVSHTAVPAEVATLLGTLGHPFTIAQSGLALSQAMYFPTRRQIWWSVPVQGRPTDALPITLVYTLGDDSGRPPSWAVWTMTPASRTDGTKVSCMVSGVIARRPDGERAWTVNALGELQRMEGYRDGTVAGGGNWYGVPLIWQSGRLFKDTDTTAFYRPVRFKMLSRGKSPATNKPRFFVTGEELQSDTGDAALQENAGDLVLHPDDTKTYFWNTGVWGTMKWAGSEWFTSKAEGGVLSQSIRVGIVDNPSTDDRGNLVELDGFSVDVDPVGRR